MSHREGERELSGKRKQAKGFLRRKKERLSGLSGPSRTTPSNKIERQLTPLRVLSPAPSKLHK